MDADDSLDRNDGTDVPDGGVGCSDHPGECARCGTDDAECDVGTCIGPADLDELRECERANLRHCGLAYLHVIEFGKDTGAGVERADQFVPDCTERDGGMECGSVYRFGNELQ